MRNEFNRNKLVPAAKRAEYELLEMAYFANSREFDSLIRSPRMTDAVQEAITRNAAESRRLADSIKALV